MPSRRGALCPLIPGRCGPSREQTVSIRGFRSLAAEDRSAAGVRGQTGPDRPAGHGKAIMAMTHLHAMQFRLLLRRLALSAPPVAVRCPSVACLLCGVTTVSRAADRGSPSWWRRGNRRRRLDIDPHEPRLEAQEPVHGHVCPSCAAAIEEVGAVGPSAIGHAVVAYLRSSVSKDRAKHLRSMLADQYGPSLPAWGRAADPTSAERGARGATCGG
jgi:hypothetical protein